MSLLRDPENVVSKLLILWAQISRKLQTGCTLPGCTEDMMPGTTQTTEMVDKLGVTRELPDNQDDCHKRIVQLEDAVTREVERNWNSRDLIHKLNEKKWVDKNRHKAMVGRILTQMPLEWIRKYIYDTDPMFTTVDRKVLEDELDGYEGSY